MTDSVPLIEITQHQRMLAASFADIAHRRTNSSAEAVLCLLMAAQVTALSHSDAPAFFTCEKLNTLFTSLNAAVVEQFPAGRNTETR